MLGLRIKCKACSRFSKALQASPLMCHQAYQQTSQLPKLITAAAARCSPGRSGGSSFAMLHVSRGRISLDTTGMQKKVRLEHESVRVATCVAQSVYGHGRLEVRIGNRLLAKVEILSAQPFRPYRLWDHQKQNTENCPSLHHQSM